MSRINHNVYNNVRFVFAGGIIKDLSSTDEHKARIGMIRAQELLGDDEKSWEEGTLKTVQNGTKINREAFEDLGKPREQVPADAGKTISIFYLS